MVIVNNREAERNFKELTNVKAVPVSKYIQLYYVGQNMCLRLEEAANVSEGVEFAIVGCKDSTKYAYFKQKYWKVLDKTSSKFINAFAFAMKGRKNGIIGGDRKNST